MAELVDALDSKSCDSNIVRVRFPLWALNTGLSVMKGRNGLFNEQIMSLIPTFLKRSGVFCLILLGALACNKQQSDVPQHEPTEEEKVKLHLEASFTTFATKLDLQSYADAKEYIVKNSVVSMGMDGAILYNLRQNGESMLWLKFSHLEGEKWKLDGDLYGGLEFHGILEPLSMIICGPKSWEKYWNIHVYDQGKDVATLGLEVYDLGYIPVFRFPDGTSYSITTVLLVEPLVDYLLNHVVSTD